MIDPILQSEAALTAFIDAFLAGTFPGDLWHHREHIIMAGWHLLRYPEAETIERIREAIKRYRIARGGENDDTSGNMIDLSSIPSASALREHLRECDRRFSEHLTWALTKFTSTTSIHICKV